MSKHSSNLKKLRFESLEDRRLLATFDVILATDTGVASNTGSLSWAIA